MSIKDFFVKEKPFFTGITRGLGGFGFGAAGGGEGGIGALAGASGGTLVSPNPGGYELRHFPSGPSTFSYTSSAPSSKIHVVIVAGGGGGHFGGGGAGGVAYAYNLPVPVDPDSFTIAIGAGGDNRATGGDSTFAGHPVGTITAKGGGGGQPPNRGNDNTMDGSPGGGGGGAGHSTSPMPVVGTTTQPSQNPGYSWPEGALYQYGQPGGLGNQPNPACCEGGGGGGAVGPSPLTASLPTDFIESGTYRDNASTNLPGDGNGGGGLGNLNCYCGCGLNKAAPAVPYATNATCTEAAGEKLRITLPVFATADRKS